MKAVLLGILKAAILNKALTSAVLKIVIKFLYEKAEETEATYDDATVRVIEDSLIKLGIIKPNVK